MSISDIKLQSWVRGYHVYHDVWTNIAVDQELVLLKQPNNQFDKHAIGGFVKGLNLEDDDALTEIGHLPRDLSRALKNVTEEELASFSCAVADKKAVGAPGLKGLQIKVLIGITLTAKKSSILRRKLKKLQNCGLVL